jgi:nucleoside-diphosphate-sugar epimerase
MNKPSIIITGANGFIGEQLVNYFSAKVWLVKAFVHAMPTNKIEGVEYVIYNLEYVPNENIFNSVNYLVHAAYLKADKNKNAEATNIEGTKRLLDICRKHNVKFLFISSFSAHKEAESQYGKIKLASEKLFDVSKDVILKPGFVLGKKGLSGQLIERIQSSRFFPLFGGGLQPIQTIAMDDFCLIVDKVFSNNISGLYHVAEPDAISMKVFYEEIALQSNKTIKFVSFPTSLLLIICKVFESVGIKLPVSSENVKGLKHLTKFDTKEDLNKIGIRLKNYKESLQFIFK